jgi:hypothetical protein
MCYCVDVDVRKSNPFPGTHFTNIFTLVIYSAANCALVHATVQLSLQLCNFKSVFALVNYSLTYKFTKIRVPCHVAAAELAARGCLSKLALVNYGCKNVCKIGPAGKFSFYV